MHDGGCTIQCQLQKTSQYMVPIETVFAAQTCILDRPCKYRGVFTTGEESLLFKPPSEWNFRIAAWQPKTHC